MSAHYGETELNNHPSAFGGALTLADGPLDLSWHHCSTTSAFLGEFYALRSAAYDLDYNEARHCIGYLLNELLENAVKFRSSGDILIEASLESGRFEVKVSNVIDERTAERFRALLEEITKRDPGELLIERIEANAEDSSFNGSGLGLLTLMSDYGAKLGWTFLQSAAGEPIRLNTYAALNLA
ncbi:slr1658 superfamily regulator [Nitratireductor sp. GCM10026969]|uniref:slr1658 superfamily regulator n=1 Tax=Nitratireductor sp. GCM10026969 TaxID=3252645 RepID=UPI0036161903